MVDLAEAPVGHNRPPSVADQIRQALEVDAAALVKRRDELLGAASRAPVRIDDDETAGKVADLIKLITACHKNAEAERVAQKEPHLEAGRAVDGFFKRITEPLEKAKRGIEGVLTAYQRRKADEERRRREEEARLAREAEERARREAEAAAKAAQTDEQLDTAIAQEETAKQAQADAEAARKAAEAKPAELSRTRGDYGAVASLKTWWDFADLDRDKLSLEPLRAHLPQDALEKAVRSFIKAGGRELVGVRIFENTSTVVR